MDPSGKKVFSTIGVRLRKARLENNMTQETLAGPEFTKGYVSALERGAVRPSLKALDVFSRRLNIPMSDFISERLDENTTPERESFQEDLVYRFNYAKMLIRTGSASEALDYLSTVEEEGKPFIQKLPARLGYWLPYLRGLTYMQMDDYGAAQLHLASALAIVEKETDVAAAVSVRDAMGAVLLRYGAPEQALEHHRECLKAVKAGKVRDISVCLSVYNNLVDDYQALGDTRKALNAGREALKACGSATDLQQQALNYWQMASQYKDAGAWSDAKTYATRALHILGAADSKVVASSIAVKTAALLTDLGKSEEAEEARELLEKAGELLSGTGNNEMQSRLYLEYSELAHSAGDLTQAADYANRGVLLSDQLRQETSGKAGMRAQLGALKLYTKAVCVAALIAEELGKTDDADSLFDQALDSIRQPELSELLSEVFYSRAQVYEQRGDHKKAMDYYRQAAQASPK